MSIRISIPQKNIQKFKEVLLYVLDNVGARANVGMTVIYKLLYFIDFDFYELYEEQLMGLEYIKNLYGPTPKDFVAVVEEMRANEEIEEVETEHFNKYQKKYLPLRAANLDLLSTKELEHINYVISKYARKSAKELSDISHKDIPWITAKDKEVLEYESVFYRTSDTSARSY